MKPNCPTNKNVTNQLQKDDISLKCLKRLKGLEPNSRLKEPGLNPAVSHFYSEYYKSLADAA